MLLKLKAELFAVLGIAMLLIVPSAQAAPAPAATAIDILLKPDATMMTHAEAANARLLKVFPKGFALDASHHPHVSVVQTYVNTADLPKVYAAVAKVLTQKNPAKMKLMANGYYFIPDGQLGLGGIVAKPTPELLALQQAILAAIKPYVSTAASAAAFYTTPAEPDINQPTIDYVAAFNPKEVGSKYNPHVTIGVAPAAYLQAMVAEPFQSFSFGFDSAAVYHLGNYGAARVQLKALPFKH